MLKLFGVNPFAEAMLYYGGIANDSCVRKRLAKITKLQPEHKDELEKMLEPVIQLEDYLNSNLETDNALVSKYFEVFANAKTRFPFGFCLAAMMVFYPLMEHIEYSLDDMCAYLRQCSFNDRTYSFLLSLVDSYETVMPEQIKTNEVLKRLENSNLSSEDKWRILQAAYDYQTHIEELLSLIIPAAKLIESRKSLYSPLTEEFGRLYTDENVKRYLSSDFNKELEFADTVIILPSLFGFDTNIKIFPNKFTMSFESNDSPESPQDNAAEDSLPPTVAHMLTGICRHMISRLPHNEVVTLSKKLQTLSDPTRLEILIYLCSHKEYGRMLCKKFGLQHSTLSYHITKLLASGFITAEISGTQTFYTADKEGIQRMVDALAEKMK